MSSAMVWWLAVMAFLNNLTAGAMLTGLVGVKPSGFAALIVGSLQAGTAAYMAGKGKYASEQVKPEIVREARNG